MTQGRTTVDVRRDVSIREYTSFRIGGTARFFLNAERREDIVEGLAWAGERGIRAIVVGTASNVLFNDEHPFDGLFIRNAWTEIVPAGEEALRVASGTPLPALVDYFTAHGFSGMEWAAGIPGTVGGSVYGNAGAFGGEMKDSVLKVAGCRYEGGAVTVTERGTRECAFGYRDSVFKHTGEVILETVLKCAPGDRAAIERETADRIRYRRDHLPLEYPSAGSFFKNIPVDSVAAATAEHFRKAVKNDPFPLIPVAAVIAEAGLMGRSAGGAQVSEKHPNFLINRSGAATFRDMMDLVGLVREEVGRRYGIALEPEVQILK